MSVKTYKATVRIRTGNGSQWVTQKTFVQADDAYKAKKMLEAQYGQGCVIAAVERHFEKEATEKAPLQKPAEGSTSWGDVFAPVVLGIMLLVVVTVVNWFRSHLAFGVFILLAFGSVIGAWVLIRARTRARADQLYLHDLLERAERGDAEAQYDLGFVYQSGKAGMSRDDSEALKWYFRAAKQGHPHALCSIATAFQMGWGVSQDHAKAMMFYREAAKQGSPGAQRELDYGDDGEGGAAH